MMGRKKTPFNDSNLRVSLVSACVSQLSSALDQLELPETAKEALKALGRLVKAGCRSDFVLETTWIYALLQYGIEQNREAEAGTRPEDRKLSFMTAGWARRDLDRHVAKCRELASEIEEFLRSARIPGRPLFESAEALMY